MADDDDAQDLAGEFPPGLESLSVEIERLASSQRRGEDIREQVERIAGKAVPVVNEARRALDQAHGDTDPLSGRIRDALSGMGSQASIVLFGTGSLSIGNAVYAAASVTGGVPSRLPP